MLACDGNYVANNPVFRAWVGYLYGKLYNGPIIRNPDYTECRSGGGGGRGGELEPVIAMTTPTVTPSMTCGGGAGGEGGSVWRCYTVTIDHYYYYPDTGEIEYRYTEQYTYCEQLD